jgi:hypothetical protein
LKQNKGNTQKLNVNLPLPTANSFMQTGRSKLYVQRNPATDLGLVHGTGPGRTHIDTEAGADMEEDSQVP